MLLKRINEFSYMRLLIKIVLSALVAVALLIAAAAYYINQQWQKDAQLTQSVFVVEPGWSYYRLLHELKQQGTIEEVLPFKVLLWLHPELRKLKAGTYRLAQAYNQRELIEFLVHGKQAEFKITFIEGSRWRDWLLTLQQHPHIKKTLTDFNDPRLMDLYGPLIGDAREHINQSASADVISQYSLIEGLLFPDTYVFLDKTTDFELIKQAFLRMTSTLDMALTESNTTALSPYEVLILASIIEKETSVIEEMPIISSVFHNRLKKKMRLQTDPTVIYGLGDEYKGDITRAHLKQYTLYNTYRIKGLPPTPIAMPGEAAIKAAISPIQSPYYYFVASGNGGHVFSKTLSEHNRAVKAYLKLLKNKKT